VVQLALTRTASQQGPNDCTLGENEAKKEGQHAVRRKEKSQKVSQRLITERWAKS